MFVWKDSYTVGIKEVDNQHIYMLELANEIFDDSFDSVEQQDSLSKFIEFAEFHFNSEEELMKKHNYPDLIVHRNIHQSFINQLLELKNEVIVDDDNYIEVLKFIKHWFVNHFTKIDQKLYRFFKGKGIEGL